MKPSACRKASFFARFLAGFLIAGQLSWGLPAHAADTLRAGQEAETRAAGLEDTLKAFRKELVKASLQRSLFRLRKAPGGRLTAERLKTIFEISQDRYYKHKDFLLELVRQENIRRAGLKLKKPFIFEQRPQRPPGTDEETLRAAIARSPGGLLSQTTLSRRTKIPYVTVARSRWRVWAQEENELRAKRDPPGDPIYTSVEEAILEVLRKHPGGLLEGNKLAGELDITYETLRNHRYWEIAEKVNKEQGRTGPALIRLSDRTAARAAGAEETLERLSEELVDQASQARLIHDRRSITPLPADWFEKDSSWRRQREQEIQFLSEAYRLQVHMLRQSGLLERVVYPAFGIDLFMLDAATKTLAIDPRTTPARIGTAHAAMKQRFGPFLRSPEEISSSLQIVNAELQDSHDELARFIGDSHAEGPVTLYLHGAGWIGELQQHILDRIHPLLLPGDRVVVFDEPIVEAALRSAGYVDYWTSENVPASALQNIKQANERLGTDPSGGSTFFLSGAAGVAGGLNLHLAEPFSVLIKTAGVEERVRVVIGPSVADKFAGLKTLPGIQERIWIDEESEETIVRLLEAGVEEVQYYGSAREGRRFGAMVAGLLSAQIRSAGDPEFLAQLGNSFLKAGVPQGMIAAGIEALAAGAEELRQAV